MPEMGKWQDFRKKVLPLFGESAATFREKRSIRFRPAAVRKENGT